MGSSISLDDAEEMFANPVVLDSPMVRAIWAPERPRGQTVAIADVRVLQMINNDPKCESPPLPIFIFGRLGTLAVVNRTSLIHLDSYQPQCVSASCESRSSLRPRPHPRPPPRR